MKKAKRVFDAIFLETVKNHPQFYYAEFGDRSDQFWMGRFVRAQTPEKARKKALRLQKKFGCRFMHVNVRPAIIREVWAP